MTSFLPLPTGSFAANFFAPLAALWPQLTAGRDCPELSDAEFIHLGVARVLSQAASGRDFLQTHAEQGAKRVAVSHFFETLRSPRRLALGEQINAALWRGLGTEAPDRFAACPELEGFDLHAGDGHCHAAAAHDPTVGEGKQPVTHFFLLNLRSLALQHFELALSGAGRKREHDMHALKRTPVSALRLGAAKGRKVLLVWDRAGIDFRFWHQAKQAGVYFLSREKENMALEVVGVQAFDRADARNQGVQSDELVATSQGVVVRRVRYRDPVAGVSYTYLTTELHLPPGLIALLYKRRWDIEKTFDELKNRLEEKKAWATSANAKRLQAQLLCIAHNLCRWLEVHLLKVEDLRNVPEERRRAARLAALGQRLAAAGETLTYVARAIPELTQRGAKLIRWIRNHLYGARLWQEALLSLRSAYACL